MEALKSPLRQAMNTGLNKLFLSIRPLPAQVLNVPSLSYPFSPFISHSYTFYMETWNLEFQVHSKPSVVVFSKFSHFRFMKMHIPLRGPFLKLVPYSC